MIATGALTIALTLKLVPTLNLTLTLYNPEAVEHKVLMVPLYHVRSKLRIAEDGVRVHIRVTTWLGS